MTKPTNLNQLQKTLLVLFLLSIMLKFSSKAQHIRFDYFDTRKGLSQNNINSLIVDSTGYVWFGTIEGITRFDGSNYDIFRSTPSIENSLEGNYIEQLSSCPNGNIWVHIQERGINKFDASSNDFRIYPDSCFSPGDAVHLSSMVSFSDSVLWFTDPNGLYKYNAETNVTTKFEVPFKNGHLIYGGNKKVFYWGSGGIYSYPKDISNDLSGKMIINSVVQSVSPIYNDSLILFNSNQLKVLNINNNHTIPLKTNAEYNGFRNKNRILSIAGYKNEIWLGLEDGLALLQNQNDTIKDITKYSYDPFNDYSFHGKDAKNLIFDKAGNLWIGTSKYGANLYSRRENIFGHHLISVLSKSDQEIDPIRAICKTSDGNIWIGFDRLGLVCIKPDNSQILYSQIYFPKTTTKSLENIRSLYEDSNKELWIGTNNGLCKYNAIKNQIESCQIQYNWDWPDVCYQLKEYSPGELTVTNFNGIATINLKTGELKEISMPDNYIKASIRSLTIDKKSNYWFILGDYGLCKLTPNSNLSYFTYEKNNLTDNKLYALELIGNTMWIGSNNGLMAFDIKKEKVIDTFFETDGLSNNLIYSVIHEDGQLWMSTNRGINKLKLEDNSIERFLTENVFMDDAFFQDSEGKIYFGGYNGFISFDPQTTKKITIPIHPIITDLYINNQKVKVGEKIDDQLILPRSIQNLNSLNLNYSSNAFSLYFNAFPFNYPDLSQFRYRLKGLSSNWVVTSQDANRAVFTNLSPGNYTFEIEASQDAQIWSAPAQLSISIIPPFYRTVWFKWISLSLVVIVILTVFKIRLYTIKRWNLQLETQIREQTFSIEKQKNKIIAQKEKMVEMSNQLHEADQAKLKYYTNLSHEFRTPLTIIMGNIETLREQGVNQYILKNIKKSSDRLFRLVNQFIDLRKYDQGELKLKITHFDIVSFTSEITDSFKDLALRKNINIEILNTNDKILLWFDKDKTDKIIYNILSNALKYTENGDSVIIDFVRQEDGLVLRITDTGTGIPEDEQENIFNRFFRGEKNSLNIDGHGMGLALVKALVDIQQGNIRCTSQLGEGTTFHLFFKWGNKHFKESEIFEEEPLPDIQRYETRGPIVIEPGNPSGDKVLLVEDNPELLEYLSSLLCKYYKIETATNGREALKKLKLNIPDLIITDLMMPVMDGIELSKTVKEVPETRFIPIIILSAKTDISSKIEGFQTNIDDFIEKPFDPNLFLSRVSNIINKHNEIRKNIEQFTINKNDSWSINDKSFFKKILIILDNNYPDPVFNADTLSNMVGMSRVTLYRKMKQLGQESPGEFIRKYRLKKAANLMKEGSKAINEICMEVGFQSLSHFRKSFKEEYGSTPLKYREIHA